MERADNRNDIMTDTGRALTIKEKDAVLQLIRERPGTSASVLCKHSGMRYRRLLHYVKMLMDEGKVTKEGNMSSSRYYCGEDAPEVLSFDAVSNEDHSRTDDVDIGGIMDAIDRLRSIGHTNTDADTYIMNAIDELNGKVSCSLRECPFCGSKPTIIGNSGQYHIECTCGCLFAYSRSTRSATETIRAYNTRSM